MGDHDLGSLAVLRIMKRAGADRVSEEGVEGLRTVLEDIAKKVAICAVDLSVKATRKTVTASDIRMAARIVLGSAYEPGEDAQQEGRSLSLNQPRPLE